MDSNISNPGQNVPYSAAQDDLIEKDNTPSLAAFINAPPAEPEAEISVIHPKQQLNSDDDDGGLFDSDQEDSMKQNNW